MAKIFRKIFHQSINKIYQIVLLSFDWLIVPLGNIIINYYLKKNPKKLESRLDKSINNGLTYFQNLPSITLEAIITLTLFVNETFDKNIASLNLKRHLRDYTKEWKDPHLRIFDIDYDPERDGAFCPNTLNIEELSGPEKPLPKCLYADNFELKEDFLNELLEIDDKGGYGTTHVLLGCAFLNVFSAISKKSINRVIASMIDPLVKAQRNSRASDIYMERIVFLKWLGYNEFVKPAWIFRIIKAQLPNGGWPWKKYFFPGKAAQHPTALAIAALIQYREDMGTYFGCRSKPKRFEIGYIYPCSKKNNSTVIDPTFTKQAD